MKIGISEPIPLLENRIRFLFRDFPLWEPPYSATAENAPFDVILWDRNRFDAQNLPKSSLYLISGEILPQALPEEGLVITGGMGIEDTVTFSSIGEDRAMLCLQQEIPVGERFIAPFEISVPFDRNYNLYKNLAAGFCLALTLMIREEETNGTSPFGIG